MRILIINYRYFVSGGPERYLFNAIALLEKHGHKVIVFSVKNIYNEPSEYEKYFLSSVGKGDEIYANQYNKKDIKSIVKVILRFYYSFEAKRKIKILVKNEMPEIAYVLHYQNKISCSVIDALYKMKIPIVHRISDFGHICSNSILFNKKICEECLYKSKFYAVINKCVYGSYLKSLIKLLSLKFEELRGIPNKINYYIFPSKFTMDKYIEYGIPKSRCSHIPTFFNIDQYKDENIKYDDFILYVGRISPEKGILTLVNAFIGTNFNLKIIGFSSNGYDNFLKSYLSGREHNIDFLGKMDFNKIRYYLRDCLFTVIPSECYENMPNTILESYAFKKPVLTSDLPSFKEYVYNNETGLLFNAGNYLDLRIKAQYLINNKNICKYMGENGYRLIRDLYSPEVHYKKLIATFIKLNKKEK